MSEKRDRTYGTGILGTGHVHTGWYAGELRESSWAEVKAVADPDEERTRGMLGPEMEHIADYYEDPASLLARDDIEVVLISSETCQHIDFAVQALEAGKHVCMEKVIAMSLEEADTIIGAARKAGVKLICPPFAHDNVASLVKAKEILDAGLIGEPTMAHFHTGHEGLIYSKFEEWFYDAKRSGGGALMDLGVHPIYDSLYLFGEAAEVSSVMHTHFTERMLGDYPLKNISVDDNAVTTIKFKNGTICATDVSFTRMGDQSNSAIYGTHGSIMFGGAVDALTYTSTKSGEEGWQTPKLPELKPSTENIVDMIENETDTWRVNGQWARQVLEVTLAAYKSDATGGRVKLPL